MRETNTAASEEGKSSPKRREEAVQRRGKEESKEHEGKDIRLYLEMGKRKEQTIAGPVDTSISNEAI
jgi:hypothetical protein